MVKYEVIKVLAELSATETTRKLLTVVSWNGNAPKLDLRAWRTNSNGDVLPGKGVTLDTQEMQALIKALAQKVKPTDNMDIAFFEAVDKYGIEKAAKLYPEN